MTDPFAEWPDRTPLLDQSGHLITVFTLAQSTRSGRPWADGVWRPESASVEAARDALLAAIPGHAVSTSDAELARALDVAGASRVRHAHVMSHELTAIAPGSAPTGVMIRPLSADQVCRHAQRLGELSFRAYPPGHPDHEHSDVASAVREIRGIGRGEILGPCLPHSRVALVAKAIVGGCLLVEREGAPPEGGAWIIDVFRDPACPVRGIGRALIASSLAAAAAEGLPALSLAVSHSNAKALALYRALGFDDISQSWTLALP